MDKLAKIFTKEKNWGCFRIKNHLFLYTGLHLVLTGFLVCSLLVSIKVMLFGVYEEFVTNDLFKITRVARKIPRGTYNVYVKLTNLYQNNRDYFKGYSKKQLTGKTLLDTQNCGRYSEYSGKKVYPCGIIANTVFNDNISFQMLKQTVVEEIDLLKVYQNHKTKFVALKLDRKDIANEFHNKLKTFPKSEIALNNAKLTMHSERFSEPDERLPFPDEPFFGNWFKPAPTSLVVKLYAKLELEHDLEQNDFLVITNDWKFPIEDFGGRKTVVISNVNMKNNLIILVINSVTILVVIVNWFLGVLGAIFNRDINKKEYSDSRRLSFY